MNINYHYKKFKALSNSSSGEVDSELVFHYKQEGNILSCHYSGANILKGHLLGIVDENGAINMRYHQINTQGELRTGKCTSTPEILPSGQIRLHESWQWTSGDQAKGTSILEEL